LKPVKKACCFQEEQRKQSLLDNRDDEDTDIDGVPLDDNDDDVQVTQNMPICAKLDFSIV
jgi:hypothetical protein